MSNDQMIHTYAAHEERINALSHAFGAILAAIATVFMLIKGHDLHGWQFFGLVVYGLSMILLFSSSSIYHFAVDETVQGIDHLLVPVGLQRGRGRGQGCAVRQPVTDTVGVHAERVEELAGLGNGLLIRTGGEMRISNFLLWQAAYSELLFSDRLWPDCDRAGR